MRKYRSLVAWQRAHQLALSILKSTDETHHPRTRAAETEILLELAAESGYLPADVFGRTQPLVDETIDTLFCLLRKGGGDGKRGAEQSTPAPRYLLTAPSMSPLRRSATPLFNEAPIPTPG